MTSGGAGDGATGGAAGGDGEEVYSSDGLPPLDRPRAPVQSSLSLRRGGHGGGGGGGGGAGGEDLDGVGGDVLDDGGNVDPVEAFEVFKGRLFVTEPNVVRGDGRSVASLTAPAPSASISTEHQLVETPLQRLTRLRMEVTELEGDIRSSAAACRGENDDPSPPLGDMTRLARELADRLDAVTDGGAGGGGGAAGLQADLTDLVRGELDRMRKQRVVRGDDAAAAKDGKGGGGGVVYELYASAAASDGAGGSASDSFEAGLERRLVRVERAVGGGGGGGGSSSSGGGGATVLERLERAERMAGAADGPSLDAAAARARVIRADLEAAVRARSKLASSSMLASGPSAASAEDAKTISSLHDQMRDVEQVSAQLPAVVRRLRDLAALHGAAADFLSRLSAVEAGTRDAAGLLGSLEEALERVEGGCASNLDVIEANMKRLDDRIGALTTPSE